MQKESQPREGFKEGGFMVRIYCYVNNRQLRKDINRSTESRGTESQALIRQTILGYCREVV